MSKEIVVGLNILFLMIATMVTGQGFKDYYPLHVGDYWIERSDSIYGKYQPVTFRVDVEGTDVIKGQTYFRMKQRLSSDGNEFEPFLWYVWLRPASDGIFIGAFGDSSVVIDLEIPIRTIDVDGFAATDWSGINPFITDPQGDDSSAYTGDDIRSLYIAKDVDYLYLRMDLWDEANTNFQNGPPPNDGKYVFQIENNGPYGYLELGIAYDMINNQWSLGHNGSNGGNVPEGLEGPDFVGVNGKIIELKIPFNLIGNPTQYYEIRGEVASYYFYYGSVLDEAGLKPTSIFDPPNKWLSADLLTPGYQWEFNSLDLGGHFVMIVESISETVQVPAGTFYDCIKINQIIVSEAGDTSQTNQIYFARGVGEVYKTSWSDSMKSMTYELVDYSVQSLQVQTGDTVHAGENLDLSISSSNPNFQPTSGWLYYRKGGETDYDSTALNLSGTDYTGTIPPVGITLRGVEYYISLSDGRTTVSYPSIDAQNNPLSSRVKVDEFKFPLKLPGMTYKMISIPLELDDPSIYHVFSDYDYYDIKHWRLLRWQQSDSTNLEYWAIRDAFTPGTAFWLITRSGDAFTIRNGWSINASQPVSYTMQPGWNQVGNPFAFPIAADSIRNTTLLERPVYYNGREYEYDVEVIFPWEGYFVYNTSPDPVTIFVLPIEEKNTGLPKTSNRMIIDSASEYLLQFSATMPGTDLIDSQNYIGLLKNATAERDILDFTEAPPIGEYLQLSIIENQERFAGNFKPIQNEGEEWEFEIRSSAFINKNIDISLIESGSLPDGFQFYLLDKDFNCSIPTESKKFSVCLSEKMPVRRFKVILGTEQYAENHNENISLVPIAFQLEQNYPNPFNPETTIQYQLGKRSPVVLEIYNMLGQKICTLVDDIQNTGQHTVKWDGLNASGEDVSSGIYIYQIKTNDFTASRKLVLIR